MTSWYNGETARAGFHFRVPIEKHPALLLAERGSIKGEEASYLFHAFGPSLRSVGIFGPVMDGCHIENKGLFDMIGAISAENV